MGPTWYWMPDVFENFFNNFGKNISDYYNLIRLNPSYKFFHEDNKFNIPLEIEKLTLSLALKSPKIFVIFSPDNKTSVCGILKTLKIDTQ